MGLAAPGRVSHALARARPLSRRSRSRRSSSSRRKPLDLRAPARRLGAPPGLEAERCVERGRYARDAIDGRGLVQVRRARRPRGRAASPARSTRAVRLRSLVPRRRGRRRIEARLDQVHALQVVRDLARIGTTRASSATMRSPTRYPCRRSRSVSGMRLGDARPARLSAVEPEGVPAMFGGERSVGGPRASATMPLHAPAAQPGRGDGLVRLLEEILPAHVLYEEHNPEQGTTPRLACATDPSSGSSRQATRGTW